MAFLIAIGAYLLFLVLVCLFLKGGGIRESPKPQPADVEIDPLEPMQSEPPSMIAFEPECLGEWSGKVGLSAAPLAQPDNSRNW